MKNRKKGFTIVELVIVIAVIAILAAILVPSFSNLVKKANIASDTATVKILNEYLEIEEETTGEKQANMTEVVDFLNTKGFNLERYRLKNSEHTLLWNQETNRFVIMNGNEVFYAATNQDYKYWEIVDNVPTTANQKYNIYLREGFKGSTVTVAVGFDAGKNDKIETVNVTVAQSANYDLVVRTNGGELKLDVAGQNVHHYGSARVVEIEQVNGHSYYEHEKTTFIKVSNARVVVETEAEVGQIYLPENAENVILATRGSAELPVVSSEDANKTVEVQTLVAGNDTASTTTTSETLPQKTENTAKTEAAKVVVPPFADNIVACIGWNGYETLMKAIDSVPANSTTSTTITLLKDASGSGLATSLSNADKYAKNIIIDFNGHTYRVNGTAVGSTNTKSQAMHWAAGSTIVMKNGKFEVSDNATNVKMAMQNYATFTAENMHFDFTRIVVGSYGENEFNGANAIYNGLEIPFFNNNGTNVMTLTNCTVVLPATSTKGVYNDNGTLVLNNTQVDGYVCLEQNSAVVKLDANSTAKGVVSYFAGHEVESDTTANVGYTTYSLAN